MANNFRGYVFAAHCSLTYAPTVHQRHRRMDRWTTYDSNTALCTTCIAQ